MRRLNESASWLSDVTVSDASDANESLNDQSVQMHSRDTRILYLADMLNESATWIDCDISDSDREDYRTEHLVIQPLPPGPMIPVRGMIGVGRSYSC